MGHITDNTRTRYGVLLPYILWAALRSLLPITLFWLFPGWTMSPSSSVCSERTLPLINL